MVERQSGMLSKLKEGEVVEDLATTSLDGAPVKKSMTVDQLAADAHLPLVDPLDELFTEVDSAELKIVVDLDTENWMSKLNEDEIFNSEKGPAPRLHGLRRLAKPFILKEDSRVNALIVVPREHVRKLETSNGEGDVMSQSDQVGTHHFPMASVTFNITLRDGRTFSDSADAFYSNCEALALFPTAVASARAEARCLRKVLGIREHAAEEIVDKDPGEELAPDDNSPIKPEQTKLIEKILKQVEMSLKDLLEEITTREVFSAEELTTGEARKALRLLNDYKKKKNKKKASKKS